MALSHDELAKLDKTCLWHPFTPQQRWQSADPVIIERAQGCTLIDDRGKRYLDGVSSLWTNVHGHGHPIIDQAIRDQLGRMAHSTMLGLTHAPAIELAQRLLQCTPSSLSRVFYSDNGSTATEIAVKMAFQAQQSRGESDRTLFATLRDAYHGDTIGAVSVGGIDLFHATFRPLLFPTEALPAPLHPGGEEEEQALHTALGILDRVGHRLAALIVEPLVQGAAGMKMHSPRYLQSIADRAAEKGVLLIVDEVATGFGRTGTMFAIEHTTIQPDFLCLAKGISGGYLPLAATLASEQVYEAFLGLPEENKQFFHGHTYTGNPLACAAAIASLGVFKTDNVLDHVTRCAQFIAPLLEEAKQRPWVSSVRQRGVMVGIDLCAADGSPLPSTAPVGYAVAMAARPLGAIVRPLGNTLVLNPPLALSLDQWAHLIAITLDAAESVVGRSP